MRSSAEIITFPSKYSKKYRCASLPRRRPWLFGHAPRSARIAQQPPSSAAAASRTSLVSVRNPAISEGSPAFRPRPPRPPMISVSVSSLAGDCCGASQTADKFSSYYDSRKRSRTRRSARYGPANGRRSLFGLPNRALRAVFYENSRKKRKLVSGPRRGILCASCRPRYNEIAAGVRETSTPEGRDSLPAF